MRRTEPCPVPGCLDLKMGGRPVCRRHWRVLDVPLRQDVCIAQRRITTLRDAPEVQRKRAVKLYYDAVRAAVVFLFRMERSHVRSNAA